MFRKGPCENVSEIFNIGIAGKEQDDGIQYD
jgi:hypothetical protein